MFAFFDHRSPLSVYTAARGCCIALGLGVLALTGCAAPPAWPEQPPSRVFESEPQRELANHRPIMPAPDTAWYAGRHDLQPAVVVGPRSPVLERSVTITTDRQRIIRGQVRDHHRTTTHRSEVRHGVR